MTDTCGCCEGLEPLTPRSTANRPGLDQLSYRIGTHGMFLETMKARLSASQLPALAGLKTRHSSDPAIALLDAWALIADVLTFYQERIANEGYLRTATERRSVLELGRLVGYTLRPGVSATVYPAFTLEPGVGKDGEIPKGTRVQSIPGPGEMPQFFETSERIEARGEWNELKPRLSQPQEITASIDETTINAKTLYFQGVSTNLKANDLLLLDFGNVQIVRHAEQVELDNTANQTKVTLQEASASTAESLSSELEAQPPKGGVEESAAVSTSLEGSSENSDGDQDKQPDCAFENLGKLVEPLTRKPSLQPSNRQKLDRSFQQIFKCQSDLPSRLLTTLQDGLSDSLYQAWANLPMTEASQVKVYAFRTKASPFGHNAPLRPERYDEERKLIVYGEWTIDNPLNEVAPTADFASSFTDGQPPFTVNFTNQSTGNITSYEWNFGNSITSTQDNPGNQTYGGAGDYIVMLTVTGPGGSTQTQKTITVPRRSVVN